MHVILQSSNEILNRSMKLCPLHDASNGKSGVIVVTENEWKGRFMLFVHSHLAEFFAILSVSNSIWDLCSIAVVSFLEFKTSSLSLYCIHL